MNGDSHCYNHQHTAGALIRNGTVYRAEPTSADVCVLFQSGEMKTYSPDQFDLQQVMQEMDPKAFFIVQEGVHTGGNYRRHLN